ncbi:hypothetical protein D3C72_2281990 [compost metagenome]
MADLDHEHDQFVVLYIADDPVVANAIAPELAEFRTLQAVGNLFGVVEPGHAFFKKFADAPADNGIEFLQ